MNRFAISPWIKTLGLLLFFVSVVLGTVWFVWMVSGRWLLSKDEVLNHGDILINLLGFSATITAAFSILFVLYQSEENKRKELMQSTIEMFTRLRSNEVRVVRSLAARVRRNWDQNTGNNYRDRFLEAFISETKDSTAEPEITKKQVQAIYDLIGFFATLSLYENNRQYIRKLSYFYYGWWRSFMYEFAVARDRKRVCDVFDEKDIVERTKSRDRRLKIREEYLTNVTLLPVLKRLDRICGFEGFPESLRLHKVGY